MALSVCEELKQPRAPEVVRKWIARPPAWIESRAQAGLRARNWRNLGRGERDRLRQTNFYIASDILNRLTNP
jgi:hypothetical protein